MVGSGSFAHVYSYVDPDYGTKFAVKRAKKDLDERDLQRFKHCLVRPCPLADR